MINGFQILTNKKLDRRIKQAILTHHEHIDGSGYPLQLNGTKISKLSKILAIADTYNSFGNEKNSKTISQTPFNLEKMKLKWTSNNKNIATVNSKGVVKTKTKTGTVKITVTAIGGVSTGKKAPEQAIDLTVK